MRLIIGVLALLLIIFLWGCDESPSSISNNNLVWENFLVDGTENCLLCHSGFGKPPLGRHCVRDLPGLCKDCHSDTNLTSVGNCVNCHTGRDLLINGACLKATLDGCLTCHSDMRTMEVKGSQIYECTGCHEN